MKRPGHKHPSPAEVLEEAEQRVEQAIAQQHPEWVEEDGSCPRCVDYELRHCDELDSSDDEED